MNLYQDAGISGCNFTVKTDLPAGSLDNYAWQYKVDNGQGELHVRRIIASANMLSITISSELGEIVCEEPAKRVCPRIVARNTGSRQLMMIVSSNCLDHAPLVVRAGA